MSTLTRGDKLPAHLQAEVKASYTYRVTVENGYPRRNPCGATVPAITDAQWLKAYAFYVTKRGTLDARRHHAEPACMLDNQE